MSWVKANSTSTVAGTLGASEDLGSADTGGFAGAGHTAADSAVAGVVESRDAADVSAIVESADAGYGAEDSDVAGAAGAS